MRLFPVVVVSLSMLVSATPQAPREPLPCGSAITMAEQAMEYYQQEQRRSGDLQKKD